MEIDNPAAIMENQPGQGNGIELTVPKIPDIKMDDEKLRDVGREFMSAVEEGDLASVQCILAVITCLFTFP